MSRLCGRAIARAASLTRQHLRRHHTLRPTGTALCSAGPGCGSQRSLRCPADGAVGGLLRFFHSLADSGSSCRHVGNNTFRHTIRSRPAPADNLDCPFVDDLGDQGAHLGGSTSMAQISSATVMILDDVGGPWGLPMSIQITSYQKPSSTRQLISAGERPSLARLCCSTTNSSTRWASPSGLPK